MLQDLFPSSHIVTFTSDPWLPSHMLWEWELVRLYAFYVLNAPLQWPKPAKWLLSTAPVLRWFRLVSVRRESGGRGRGTELWLDWLTLGKGQLGGMRGEELPKWLFSLLFSPWPGQRLCMVIYERVGEREGLQWNPPAPLCCEGWAGWGACHWFGSVIYTCTHTQALTHY